MGERKYYLTVLKTYASPWDLVLDVTTPINTSAPVSFTVEVPGRNWSTAASCSYGVFTEVSTPEVVSLHGGERAIIVTPENGQPLVIISRTAGVSDFDGQVNIQFLQFSENKLTYYGTTYGFITSHSNTNTAFITCLLYTSPSPRDRQKSRMPSSA